MRKLIDDLDLIPPTFTDGYRGVLLIRRNKDGEIGNAQKKAVKRITRDVHEWRLAVQSLYVLQQTTHLDYRIYSSVNERDMTKAIHEFKRRQLEEDYGTQYEQHSFYCDIQNRFFSCLMNPNARAQNHFIIDCDSEAEYEHAELQLRSSGKIIMEYATKNGIHIITHPFNPNDYGNMQIKKDDLMFIG
jgi:hypothetical protein